MKTVETLVAEFVALHVEEAKLEPMVYEVWSDGEVTLTKGGDLYRQRTLHIYQPAICNLPIVAQEFCPIKLGVHGAIAVMDFTASCAARDILREILGLRP